MSFTTMDLFLLFSLMIMGTDLASAQTCPDLSPCICYDTDPVGLLSVYCNQVAMETIKNIFSKIPPIDIEKLSLTIQTAENSIPVDLLSSSRVINYLYIKGNNQFLIVDPDAFRSSSNTLQYLYLWQLDLSRLDFFFIAGFQRIYTLFFQESFNVKKCLTTLPFMPALTYLSIFSSGLNETSFHLDDTVLSGLTDFSVFGCNLDEESAEQLLNWMLPSSAQTLKRLNLGYNRLRFIPRQIASFTNLEDISMVSNQVNLDIQSNSFYVTGDLNQTKIDLGYSRVISIDSGAFQGNFSSTSVDLRGNLLTRIKESVFKSMLQDMVIGGKSVSLAPYSTGAGNFCYFDCYGDPCHLSWLLRDNRHLLNSLFSARCVDETFVQDLSPTMFDNCP